MRFIRYLSVQVAAYAIDMGGFVLLSKYLHVPLLAANVISKLAAGIFAFLVHRAFTFRLQGSDAALRQAAIYFALLALNLPLSALILHAMLQVVAWPVAAKFISDVICVLFNYWLSKRFVFR
ncbi:MULTISPECIES: GtrA family protein [Achromobacter]|jgi:putative flippase GtrA|uniref:GtrA family protein n=1 Tax=Achromobacter TaxID=222 RepID=UPI0012DC78CC|nr:MULTISPECIES: GtrA family protein [Achromobacter]